MKWHAPFSGVGDAWYAQGICTADVADDCFVVDERDYMSHRDDIVVYADKGSAIAIGYHGRLWETTSTGSVSMFPYRMAVLGGAGQMLDSHSGEVMRRHLGSLRRYRGPR